MQHPRLLPHQQRLRSGRATAGAVLLTLSVAIGSCSPGDTTSDEASDPLTTATPATTAATVTTTTASASVADDHGNTDSSGNTDGSGSDEVAPVEPDAGGSTDGSGSDEVVPVEPDGDLAPRACNVDAVPPVAGFDQFYVQGCNLGGFWVVAGEGVDPAAIQQAAALADAFLGSDPILARAVVDSGVRLGVIGANQLLTDMPEYRDLPDVFPDIDWNARARGLGATAARPLVSAGEENLLCLDGDRYRGEDILLHEFAHTLHLQGLAVVDPDFDADLSAAYDTATEADIWANTYAATNPEEYWAEGVQSYFERNPTAETADGLHGPIDTRRELAAADPALFALIDEHFATVRLPPSCQDRS